MKIGLIGCGTVGGTLFKYLTSHTNHEVFVSDPAKGFNDDLTVKKPYAIFISIPVNPGPQGQNQAALEEVAKYAKSITEHVFIRSTVLPGTNDRLGTYSMPEYLTARRAYEDFLALPLVFGSAPRGLIHYIFDKKILKDGYFYQVSNVEAELAKYTHNCFGAMKVIYFNMIKELADALGANFEQVKTAANVTGFLGSEHMQVPGPDGKLGFGGHCLPYNIESFANHLAELEKQGILPKASSEFFYLIKKLNLVRRGSEQ